jgi:NADH-quinone oxidoreductase subunit L
VSQSLPHNETFLIACALLVLLLPLLSFVMSMVTSQRYSWLISMNAPLLMLVSAVVATVLLFSFWNEPPYILKIEWFSIGSKTIHADIILSNESVLMLAVVASISFLVHLYSVGYMAGDANIKKYFAMLGFFTFSMQGIVLSDNLLLLFIFWELVGFSSYMLIGHWNEKPAAALAASKAFIMNRIADAGFLVGLMILWMNTGSLNLSDIFVYSSVSEWKTVASLCIFCGIVGKSAQFPLFTWLPDAMEGPTPVSALIHAATMVAAGVYLLIRTFPLFTELSLQVVAITGLMTAVLAAIAALYQNHLKRILAYSTISHLGIMLVAVGLASPAAALLHLFTHAFFKACLFLCAGSVIHSLEVAQYRAHGDIDVSDIRKLGGLKQKLPFTYYCFVISGASLAGVPLFSGFLSKDAILAISWNTSTAMGSIILLGLLATIFLSALYMTRLIILTFWGEAKDTTLQVGESPFIMRVPMAILALLSLWFVVGWNPIDFSGWLIPETIHNWTITLISTSVVALSLFTGYVLFRHRKERPIAFVANGYGIDWLYERTFVKMTHSFSEATKFIDQRVIDNTIHGAAYAQVTLAHVFAWIDRVFIDGLVNGVAWLARTLGSVTRSFQGGNIQVYIFWSLFAIIIFLIWTLN